MPDQGPISALEGTVEGTPTPDDGTTEGTPPQEGTSPQTPEGADGTAKAEGADQTKVPAKSEDEVFFDPKDLPKELLPYHKQLQSAFTKKTQAIKQDRDKIEAYDAFMQDIPGNLQRAAQQYGFKMVPSQANPPQAGVEGTQPFGPDWQPQSYGELYQAFSERLFTDLNQRFGPVFQNVERLATTNVERQLSEIDPDWKIYEDDMTANLKQHPTLAHDISKLYKMSVPDEVLNSRAVQAALKKMEEKAKSAKIQGKGTAAPTKRPGGGKMSFQESIDAAKQTLAEQGVMP